MKNFSRMENNLPRFLTFLYVNIVCKCIAYLLYIISLLTLLRSDCGFFVGNVF